MKTAVYRTIILYVVLYGHGTLSVTLNEEHWLIVSKNGGAEEDIWI